MKGPMKKLWEVTVNQWGWDRPKTYYATSRKEAEDIAEKYPASDPVRYSGNYSDDKAEWLLSDSIQTFENWLKDKSWQAKRERRRATTNHEMDANMMGVMVEDWMSDHQEEMADIVLDGKPYYDDELSAWVQECHDNTNTYVLVDNNGSVDIEYVGTL